MVQFECPRHWNPSVSFFSGMGYPVWKWSQWKIIRTKWAQRAANGPVWIPQALKPICLIQFWSWVNSLFPLLALWGNKNWPPSMKVQKMQIFLNKMGWKGCKWSSLNAPGTETPLSHSVLELEEFPFLHYWLSGVINFGLPVWKWKKWKMIRTKWAERVANGPVWMSQALKPLCLIHFWGW